MAIGEIGFLAGWWGALGVAAVVGLILLITRLVEILVEKHDKMANKPKLALSYEKEYLKHELYEELFYINKYREQLNKGEWPKEMEEKFEIACEKGTSAGLDSEGDLYTYKKEFLRLKDKFRKKKDKKDDQKGTPQNDDKTEGTEGEEKNGDDKK